MTRQYADHITVRRALSDGEASSAPCAGAPQQFVWRRRRYRVLAVMQHWVEGGSWWRSGQAADSEYEMWRVEARAGRLSDHAGVYDLRQHRSTDRWYLIRAFD